MGDADFKSVVKKLNKAVRQYVYNTLDHDIFNPNKILLDIHYPTCGMGVGKYTYASMELTIYQNKDVLPFKDDRITSQVNKLVSGIEVMFRKDLVFTYKKRKPL